MENLPYSLESLESPSTWMSLLAVSTCSCSSPVMTWEGKTPREDSVCDVTKFNDTIIPGNYITLNRKQGH